MGNKEKLEQLLNESENGIITTAQITEAGIHRGVLQELVKKGEIYQFGRGLYVRSDAWEDDFYLLQLRYASGIYSHDTALYLLGYSDRTPAKYTMTFPKGYNAPSLKQENIIVKDDILSLTLIVKNEAFYIKEWIEFHRMIGVTHFYIYDTYSAELARLRAEIKQKSLQGAEERELEALYVQSVV